MAEYTDNKSMLGLLRNHVKTRICLNPYLFKWEIENISLLDRKLISEEFSPFPKCFLYCEIIPDPFEVSLHLSRGEEISVECHMTVCDTKGKTLLSKTDSYTNCKSDSYYDYYDDDISFEEKNPAIISECIEEVDPKCLSNDVLVMVCRIYDDNSCYKLNQQQISKRVVGTPFDYLKKLATDLSSTLTKEKVYLCVGNESEIINKSILSAKSSVFKKMLQNLKPEKHKTFLTLEDVDISIVRSLVKFLNSGIVRKCDSDHLSDLYRAANKYDVPELRDACGDRLVSALNLKNVCQILVLSVIYSDDELKKHVVAFLRDNLEMVLKSDEWQFIMLKEPTAALEAVKML